MNESARRSAFRRNCIQLVSALAALALGTGPSHSGVMSLPGNFAVSPAGAATYSIPIALPPGTAGLAPSLSLDYTSQGANGLLGVGWSLSGLPQITRCLRTKAQDGTAGAMSYDQNDRYCMDGQRLAAVNGAYGADGTEYRTEVEAYSKIIAHGSGSGPDWFEVHTKSGQLLEFGHSGDAQFRAPGRVAILVWGVNKVSDIKGNYFTVTHQNSATEFYPLRIDYAGNAAASLSPYNSVQLVYETRPDVVPQYRGGGFVQTSKRLTDVKTFSGNSLITDYKLSYQPSSSSGRSELTSVAACGADNACLPATTFQWTGSGSVAFTQTNQANPNNWDFGTPPQSIRDPISADINGDGKTDILMLSNDAYYVWTANGDGTFAGSAYKYPNNWNFGGMPSSVTTPITGDFNGDGKTDIGMLSNDGYYTLISNGDGTFTGSSYKYPLGSNFGAQPGLHYFVFTADYNADGCTDVAIIGSSNVWTLFSKCDGTFTETSVAIPNGWSFGGPNGMQDTWLQAGPRGSFYTSGNYAAFAGDFNGDGRTDFTFFGSTRYYVLLSNGDGTFGTVDNSYEAGTNFGTTPTAYNTPFVGDYNGDGQTDILLMSGGTSYVFLSKGNGAFTEIVSANPNSYNFGSPVSGSYITFTGDFNGDGMSDLVLADDCCYYILTSKGNGSFAAGAYAGYLNGQTFSLPPNKSWAVLMGDFIGTGKSGMIMIRDHSNALFTVPGPTGDMITSATSGLGATTTIAYDVMTHSSVYTKGSGATYPVQDIQLPMYLVSRVNTSNGVGGNYSSTYTYSTARLHAQGRGFLGFGQTSVKDLQTGITDTTTYRQDFPFIGLVSSTKRALGTQTLGQSSNTYQSYDTGGTAPYHVYLTQNVSSGADLDGSALPTLTTANQYDAYLNATQVVVSTPDGFSKATTNTYTNDPTLWYLGRLTRATVTNVSP